MEKLNDRRTSKWSGRKPPLTFVVRRRCASERRCRRIASFGEPVDRMQVAAAKCLRGNPVLAQEVTARPESGRIRPRKEVSLPASPSTATCA